MRFRHIRRRRRQPSPPFFLLPLDIELGEIMADLVFPTPG